tara:strand:+ start:162 stop:308 length:147 start_codon:yes stop_codon:yes gene_type:complete
LNLEPLLRVIVYLKPLAVCLQEVNLNNLDLLGTLPGIKVSSRKRIKIK